MKSRRPSGTGCISQVGSMECIRNWGRRKF